MPFKIVQTLEKGKPVLTAVPHEWEKDGTLFWPKNQADKLIKVEDIYPEDNWIPIVCELKRDNLKSYGEAQAEVNSILYRGVGGHEPNRNQIVEASTSSQPRDNFVDLKIETTSQDPLTDGEAVPASVSAGLELVLENQRLLLENQVKIMRKLNEFTSRLENLTSQGNSQYFNNTDIEHFNPIDDLQAMDNLENDLKDPEKRNIYFKRYSIICQGKGEGWNCAYFLVDMFFTRKFLTKVSWSGGSRGESKFALKIYTNIINFFHSLIHDCDKTFSLMDCHNFFKLILRNSVKRSESKCMRASGKKKRLSKNIMSQIQMLLVQENNSYEHEEEVGEQALTELSKKRRKLSDRETSECETDVEKE
ncbi:uncharacterized protein LOC128669862 [Plodia interpunctella]|uniref:uncharacterized protein LOC128669862 n=1 Tax=Plodia interpunctella TaxID=58824 RepID=UPI002368C916|nr:uncharacterized protein LOC128669862 [Plodia interpunctella]